MKRILFALAAAAVAAVVVHADAGHDHADHDAVPEGTVTLKGEIIDISCYVRHESRGPKHVKCATFCATKGMPFGFLEAETGRIYLLLPDGHADPTKGLREYFGQQVQATGILTEAVGLTGLQIATVTPLDSQQKRGEVTK